MGVLDGIVGTIDSGSEYDLQAYQNYLADLMSKVINSQYNIEIMAKEITSTVMVEGKWYDDCAAEFARWWNDVGGQKDGIDYLNGLSTILENLVKITAAEVCMDMRNSTTLRASYSAYSLINDFANGNPYIHGIRNMTKADLGQIGETVCRAGVKNSANGEQINSMVARVSECADNIKSNVKELCNSIQEDLIEGRALKIKGLDSSILENRRQDMLLRVDTIMDRLSEALKNSRLMISRDEAVIKSTLDGSDASSAISAAAAATVAGTVGGRIIRPIDTTELKSDLTLEQIASIRNTNSNAQTINGGSASKGTLNSTTQTISSSISGSTGTRNIFTTNSGKSSSTTGGRVAKTFNTTNLTSEQIAGIRNSSAIKTINGRNTNSSSMGTLNSVEQKESKNYLKSEVVKTGNKSSSSKTSNKKTSTNSSSSKTSNKKTSTNSSSSKTSNKKTSTNSSSNKTKANSTKTKNTGSTQYPNAGRNFPSYGGSTGQGADHGGNRGYTTGQGADHGGNRGYTAPTKNQTAPNTTTGSKMVSQSSSTRKIANAKPPSSGKSNMTAFTQSKVNKKK